jgi:hypothetical protein
VMNTRHFAWRQLLQRLSQFFQGHGHLHMPLVV